jgi:hypothetical protein
VVAINGKEPYLAFSHRRRRGKPGGGVAHSSPHRLSLARQNIEKKYD